MAEKEYAAFVRMDIEVRVVYPPGVLTEKAVGDNGDLVDERLRDAAANAVVACLNGSQEIDGSGDLGIPFGSMPFRDRGSSMILVDVDCDTTMVEEVRVEED